MAAGAEIDYNAMSDESFHQEVREFFETRYPQPLRFLPRRVKMDEIRGWWNTLYEHGWNVDAEVLVGGVEFQVDDGFVELQRFRVQWERRRQEE